MGLFDRAKDNYDRRRDIAEYNYRAREYISEGQRIYEDAYVALCIACQKVDGKVSKYQRYKQQVLNEINRTLRSIDSSHKEYRLTSSVDFVALDSCAVHQEEKLDIIDKALATWVQPSVTDFFRDNTSEYYEAKANMNSARTYKDRMKSKRDELKNAKYAVQKIPEFIYDEQQQIEALMQKFRKTADSINQNNNSEKVEALCKIAKLVADSMTTNFIDNNYQITEQYRAVSNRFTAINNSLSSASWLIGG